MKFSEAFGWMVAAVALVFLYLKEEKKAMKIEVDKEKTVSVQSNETDDERT